MLKRVRFVTLFILSIFYVLDGYLAILHFSNITHKFSQEDQAFVDVYFNWKAASNYHHNSEEGIFEFRERDQEKFYRIFAFWDGESDSKTLILCTHGLDKKTNKTPKSDIERAIKIKKQYFKDKIK